MKYLLTGIITFIFFATSAQELSLERSQKGYILTETDSLPGVITIDLKANTLLLKNDSGITTYPARLLRRAVLIRENNVIKTFISGYYGYEQEAVFFEQLVGGTNSLLYREGLKFDRYQEEAHSPYFTKIDASVYSLGSKKEIIRLFTDKRQIAAFMKEYKLDVKVREDLILLFNHANESDQFPVGSVMAIEDF